MASQETKPGTIPHSTAMAFSDESFGRNLNALTELLSNHEEQNTQIEANGISQPGCGAPCGPGDVGPGGIIKGAKPPKVKTRDSSQDIWGADDLCDLGADELDDGRSRPKYEFFYKQVRGLVWNAGGADRKRD